MSRSEAKPPRRLFIIGCPRSGTTLVQGLLAAHPEIISFPESHFFDKNFSALGFGRYRARASVHASVRDFARRAGLDTLPRPASRAAGARSDPIDTESLTSDPASAFITLLDHAAAQRGASTWVEKTPDHVFRIDLIRRVAPDARFIHVVRRGHDVVPSLRRATRAWGRPRSWTRCALHWAAAVRVTARHVRRPEHYVVAYERVIENSQDTMRRLLHWLGLGWRADLLERHAAVIGDLVEPAETWKAASLSGAIRSPAPSANTLLPAPARWIVRAATPAYERLTTS